MSKRNRIISYILIFTSVFLLGWQGGSYYHSVTAGKIEETSEKKGIPASIFDQVLGSAQSHKDIDLNIFWEVWDRLLEQHVDDHSADKQKMVYGAIKGLAESLGDDYTTYMTPEETNEFDHSLNGELEGIGAELTVKDQLLMVVSPLKDSPAQKAGLLPEDIIYKIDGALTSEMYLPDEAVLKIRGKKGTEVNLTVVRKDQNEPFDVKIIRDTIKIDSVTMEDKGQGIYHVAINQFSDTTTKEFEQILSQIASKKPKGIIIDLRFNGGGYLLTAVDVLSALIKGEQVVVTAKQRNPIFNQILKTNGKPKLPDVPLVVLINRGSASASEIVAGAIQDLKRGIVMGEKSFGKGSVQQVEKLSDGSSLKLTIAKWYTPLDRSIDEVGIEPDIKVEFTAKDAEEKKDPQLDAAIEYLKKL